MSLLLLVSFIALLFFVTTITAKTVIDGDQFKQDLYAGKIDYIVCTENSIQVYYKEDAGGHVYYMGARARDNAVNYIDEYNEAFPDGSEFRVGWIDEVQSSFSWFYILYPILLIGGAFLIISFFTRQIGKSNRQSMDFTKNRAKIALSTVRFSDVAGAEEEKEEVKEIVEFLKNPQKFTNMGARIPRGVLLVGPPGTGKTLLAKAIAGEANVPFFTISGSDFMELFVGVGASRVRDLFDKAKKASPCIVFIDEIDAIGRQRGTGMGGGNDEREQTLNQLLVQMDGFETNEGIIIIAATNRADILDPALLRPGRFDRQIYIHVPDVKGREEILKVHAKGKKFDNDVDFKQIARVTSGFTGAEIENLLNEAAILATRDNKTSISMKDITEGIDKVTMGPQKKSRVVTERDKKITAYHEAGHAIVGRLVKNSEPIHEVSIVPRGNAAGYTVSRPENDDTHITRTKLLDTITMMLSGRKAEEIFLGDYTTGASNDIERATAIARKMVVDFGMGEETGLMHLGSENSYFFGKDYVERTTYSEHYASIIDNEIKKILTTCEQESARLINENKNKLETMVKILLQKNTIYSNEVDLIMEGKPEEEILSVIEDSDLYVSANDNKEDIEEDVGEDGLKSNIIKTPKKEKTCEDKDNKDKEIEVLPSKQISETMEDAISNKSKKTKNTKDKKD
ncbi:MAG: ATP-dependent zinc metalloprotease FtsH [Clostridia bacterium]|nr:ATP-dependent zinc metalloprotease FtsH [Clostridia bacterium]